MQNKNRPEAENPEAGSEQALLHALSLQKAVLESTADGILAVDLHGNVIAYNRRFAELCGITVSALSAMRDEELITLVLDQLKAPAEFRQKIQEMSDNPQAPSSDIIELVNGRILERRSLPQYLGDNVIGRVWSFRDITDQIQAGKSLSETETEKKLQRTNRALRLLYQCNGAVVHATAEQQLLQEICRIAVDVAGYRMAWVGQAEPDSARTIRPIAFAGLGEEFLKEVFVRWADTEFSYGTAGNAIRSRKPSIGHDLLNNPQYTVWRESIAKREFASVIALPLIINDDVYGVVLVYAAEPDAFDITEIGLLEELSGNISHGIAALRASMERDDALVALEAARSELEQRVGERTNELREKNLQMMREIERRKQVEISLRDSEQRFRAVFEQAAVGVAIVETRSDRFLRVNQRFCEITGYEPEKIAQQTFMAIVHSEDLSLYLKRMSLLINGKIRNFGLEERLKRKDGRIVWVNLTVSPMAQGETPTNHIAVIEDITNRKRAEETLRRSEEKYRELVENANSIIMRMDTKGNISFFNEYAQNFFGYKEEEILGKCVIGTIVPEKESNGRNLGEMIADIASYPEKFHHNENENMRKNGERVWIAWANKPIYDQSGNIVETLCIGNDITDLKKAETELLRAKDAAESADRLKSAFLAAMSHELRTPLNSIIGFTGIILQGLSGPVNSEQKKQLGMVSNSAHHLLALVNGVLDLSKIEAGQLEISHESYDFRDAIQKTVQAVVPLAAKKNLPIRVSIGHEVGETIGDRRRVEQVLMNLLSNAIKFTDEGEIRIDADVKENLIVTSIGDTGIGIKPEQQSELFRPFHQLDNGLTRKREGTGLGLSICKRLLELMGGTISFTSEPGKGSVFTFVLPGHGGG